MIRTAAHRRFDLVTSIPVSFVELAAYEVAELVCALLTALRPVLRNRPHPLLCEDLISSSPFILTLEDDCEF